MLLRVAPMVVTVAPASGGATLHPGVELPTMPREVFTVHPLSQCFHNHSTMLNRHVNSVSKCEIGMLVSKDHSQQAVWLASLKQLVVAFNQEKALVRAFSGH